MKVVIDSYAWIELFRGSETGEKVKKIISKAEEVYTSSIVLAEISRKYFREGFDPRTVKDRVKLIERLSIIVHVKDNLAVESGKCFLELREYSRKMDMDSPSLADAIILATARMMDAKIVTGDRHFKGLPETIWLE